MIKANKSPVLTSNNFGINYVEINPNVFKKSQKQFNNFSIKNSQIAVLEKCPNFSLTNPISKGIASMRSNTRFKLEIVKSSSLPVVATFRQKADEVVCSQILIKTNQNVNAKIILNFLGTNDTTNYAKILFESEANSTLDVIVLCENGVSFLNIEKHLKTNAKLKCFLIDFSTKISVSNIFSVVKENADFQLLSLFLTGGVVDQNFLVNLEKPNAKTNLNCLGALKQNGQKSFKGTINFLSGAIQSVGHEKEFCLLLSNSARSKSLPMLLCTEENSEGSHSSSCGQVDEAQMFYLLSRGFSKAEAKMALVRAKFQKHIDQIFDERTKNLVLSRIEKEIKSENID